MLGDDKKTDLLPLFIFPIVLTLPAIPLGWYMAKVFAGQRTFLSPIIEPLEKVIYRSAGIDIRYEMSWKDYAQAFLVFNVIGILLLFILQVIQHLLPLNPAGFGPVRWDTALNTAVSFTTNTNWQSYSGEQVMSHLVQMAGLAVQNFLSAAAGLAAAISLIRGFVRKEMAAIGNFWVDLTRSLLYILLPLAVIWAFVLVSQGAVQTLNGGVTIQTVEGRTQSIYRGPVASQVAIKVLGTNGGGFFNANSAHPFENPTPVSDFMQVLGLLIIPAALPFTFGAMLKNRRQGLTIYLAMMLLFLGGLAFITGAELQGNPLLADAGVSQGANMEGKEVRFGIVNSVLFGQSTTVTSCGAVNSMHDSYLPLSGLVLIFNMATGEVIFGGAGVGLIGMIVYAILTMFLAGLMIGRTPEFVGKKLEAFEMVMSLIMILVPALMLLIMSAVAVSTKAGISGLGNPGPHGLTEIIYAFASTCGNNGSAFAGLNANSVFYNLLTALAMLTGRFATILPALAIAGSLAGKKIVPAGAATFPTTGTLFVLMLISVIFIVGALTFFPVFVLGPLLEHLFLYAGAVF
ncbi:MAG: potassium-transporting ATPase subunit KdpA [Syntrophales bacterium]